MALPTWPAPERNKQPILEVLGRVLPASGLVLEVASGTGQHVVHFAQALPALTFQPSEIDPALREAIAARVAGAGLPNVLPPIALDVTSEPWVVQRADAVICTNMIHIAPWAACVALMRGAARILPAAGVLFLYGPYRRSGAHTAASNEAFDASLRAQNPQWGLRDMEAVQELAAGRGLALSEVIAMPANNYGLVFRAIGAVTSHQPAKAAD